MFARKEAIQIDTIIGKEMDFKGTLKGEGSIHIDGRVEGKIKVGGDVLIGKDSLVKADIQAMSVRIGGKVVGNVSCKAKVELLVSGSLKGNLKASDLTIPEGAFFEGECSMIPSGEEISTHP